jgi:hypothetical protein
MGTLQTDPEVSMVTHKTVRFKNTSDCIKIVMAYDNV